MTNLYAKINGESLRDHTAKVIAGVQRLKEILSQCHIFFDEDFWEYLERTAFIHDFGKASENFQDYIKSFIKDIKEEKKKERPSIEELIPHSSISPVLCNWFDWDITDEWRKIILSSIYYHHDRSKLYNIKTRGNVDKINESALESLRQEFNGFDTKLTSHIAENLHNINYRFLTLLIAPDILYLKTNEEARSIGEIDPGKYIFFKGFLHRADHYASSLEKGDSDMSQIEIAPVPSETVMKNVSGEILKGKDNPDSLWQFKELKEKNLKGKNTILIGSTGIGKTEFAFLWGAGKKMIFALPMRTMTDQIYKRACSIFNSSEEGNKVGLLHSSAAAALANSISKQTEMETADIETHIGLSRSMSYPVIVCTGDQILNISLKYPTYEKIMSTLGYSNLIIDEIQAYSPETSAIIVKTIQETVQLGGKFLLMTATLPVYIKKEIIERTGLNESQIIPIYSKQGLNDIKKNKIRLIKIADDNDDKIREIFLAEIKRIFAENPEKKILITINTVKQAQAIFRELMNDDKFLAKSSLQKEKENLMLLHSRFIGKDREAKVNIITGKKEVAKIPDIKLLVSTQIIEASVDIDFDILISELAPLDSLIQRMGRANRNRGEYTPGKGDVYIFDKSLKDSNFVYKGKTMELTGALLSEKFEEGVLLSEKEKQSFLNDYYNHPDYHEIQKQFKKNIDALDNLLLASSKSEAQRIFREINSVDVMPFEVYQEFEKAMVEVWQRYSTGEKKGLKIGIRQLLLNYSTSLRLTKFKEAYTTELSTYLSDEESLKEMKKELDFKRFFRGYFVTRKESMWKYDSTFGLQESLKDEK